MLTIVSAATPADISLVREMMLEYAAWLGFDLCFQGFDEELRSLPGKYAPPRGRLLLAYWDGHPAGMGALRPFGSTQDISEMKRLYVRDEFRGHSIGRKLADQLIADAAGIGYHAMRLDTLPGKMDRAITMYRQLGFREIAPYYSVPVEKMLFMELALPNSITGKPKNQADIVTS